MKRLASICAYLGLLKPSSTGAISGPSLFIFGEIVIIRTCCEDGLETKKGTVITVYQTSGVCGFYTGSSNNNLIHVGQLTTQSLYTLATTGLGR